MTTIAILPWLSLESAVNIGEYVLIPLKVYLFADSTEAQIVHKVINAFFETEKIYVQNPTLLKFADKQLTDDLSLDEKEFLFDFVELFAFLLKCFPYLCT